MSTFRLSCLVAVVLAAARGYSQDLSARPRVHLGYEIHEGQFNATGQFYNFSNVRYAAPPTGPRRFAPPVAPSADGEVVVNDGAQLRVCPNASPLWANVAVQWLTKGFDTLNISAGYTPPDLSRNGSAIPPPVPGTDEDCLFLDVLVPKAVFEANMKSEGAPVVVWIHGGGFTLGWKGQYGSGAGLLDANAKNGQEGVIYVAINYRLGLFGFLAGGNYTEQQGTPNAGLLDQRFALEWVQQNIAKFGGDPNRVTVMGESAGGGSIMHQITAYGGKKGPAPFQQAIVQSGAFLPVSSGGAREEEIYAKFLRLAGVQTLEEARALPTEKLRLVNEIIVGEAPYGDFVFNPSVDGDFNPQSPGKALQAGSYDTSIRLLVGHNLDEGLFFTSPFVFTPETFDQNIIRAFFPNAAKRNVSDYILNTLYPNDLSGRYGYRDPIARADYIISDALFSCNARFLAQASAAHGKHAAHSYLFNVPPALHGDDVAYTFYEGPAPTVKNGTLAVTMQSYFMNFAVAGDPNGPGVPQFDPYTASGNATNGVVMELGLNYTRMRDSNLSVERCDWWQQALYA